MGTLEVILLFLIFSFFSETATSSSDICSNDACSINQPVIHFPFRLKERQSETCGYPGFDLSCNTISQTVLELPKSGNFSVEGIDYVTQEVWINDPDGCLPHRLLHQLDLSDSPFNGIYYKNFTFLNCSTSVEVSTPYPYRPIACLSTPDYIVTATSSVTLAGLMISGSCDFITTVSVPLPFRYYDYGYSFDLTSDLRLIWSEPDCGDCEAEGGKCGFKGNNTRKVGCSGGPHHGLPRSARYGITIGAGIPAVMCLIGIGCYLCGKFKAGGAHQHNTESTSSVMPQPTILVMGLDGPTIESYPKLVLGESRRLPKPNDGTCPICLSEYRPKETIRSIPECQHCFHADCIDEWLKLNATCPVCRNSPAAHSPGADSPEHTF